jgi:heptosyltransferase-2
MKSQRILIWLPTPLGDAIMATPALRELRSVFQNDNITFMGAEFTRQILSPSAFFDKWLTPQKGFFQNVREIRQGRFDACILMKNSFGSALTASCGGVGRRVGYAREGRSWLLTDRLAPLRNDDGSFKPFPMVDYYLKLAEHLGGITANKRPELSVAPEDSEAVNTKFDFLKSPSGPLVILVPGGAFGPSKLWPIDRYATLADCLTEKYQATVILSVAPVKEEIAIAQSICSMAASEPINLGLTPLSGGQLKALYSQSSLVIANDTGPRHIAIALDKPIVSLFGPNNPQWTKIEYDKETQIIGKASCVPCDKPICRINQHLCMESITIEQVLEKAATFLVNLNA